MKALVITIAAAGLLLAGRPSQAVAAEEAEDSDAAVFCAKCEAVWVKTPRTVGKTTVYVSQKKMLCDGCKTAVENFFATGKLEHACDHCGTLTTCKASQEAAGEQEAEGSKFVPGHDAAHQHHITHPHD